MKLESLEGGRVKNVEPLLCPVNGVPFFNASRYAAVKPDGCVEPNNTKRRLRPGMFVAQIVGRSMEPRIPDGAWCLFQSPVEGCRRGRVVQVQHRDIDEPENAGSYTVKRYKSDKEIDGTDGWRHSEIRFLPENLDFAQVILGDVRDDEFHVIAEVVEVLR